MRKGFDTRKLNCQYYYNLLNRALQIIRREKDAKEQQRAVERLLEENLDKLDDEFPQMLRSWAMAKLSVVEPEEARMNILCSGSTVAIALNQAQTWLRGATKEQLQQWAKQLPNPEHRMQLRAFLSQKPPNSKPFESPYHWAAFCAIGQ